MKIVLSLFVFLMLLGIFCICADEKELPSIPDSKVTIPWEEFKALIEKSMAIDTSKSIPPRDYVIQSAEYTAKPQGDELAIDALLSLYLPDDKWVKILLFDVAAGLKDAKLDGKRANIVIEDDYFYLITNKKGIHNIKVKLVKKGSAIQNGTKVSLYIPEVALSTFTIRYPGKNVIAKVSPSIETTEKTLRGETTIKSIIPSTDYLTIEWMNPVLTGKEVKAKIYAQVYSLLSLGEGRLNVSSKIDYSVLKGSTNSFAFSIPNEASLNSLTGGEYSVHSKEGKQEVMVTTKDRVTGDYSLYLNYEINLGKTSTSFAIPELEIYDVERERGWIGVSAFTSVEIKTLDFTGDVEPIDIKELPQTVWNLSPNPVLVAFKYIKHPYSVTLELTTHENLTVLIAAIDNASYTTLLTDEGKMVTRGVYTVRNNLKQFLKLKMPEESEIWGSFVSERPAKPTKGEDDNEVLIQLERSTGAYGNAKSFKVEVVYFTKGEVMEKRGEVKVKLPKADIPISELTWSLWLPDEYKYRKFGGNVKEWKPSSKGSASTAERALPTSSSMVIAKTPSEKAKKEYEENIAYQQQVQAEQDFLNVAVSGGRAKGALPVKISIPERGEFKRFSKLLVTDEIPEVIIKYGGRGCLFF